MITLTLPDWFARPILRVRSFFIGRERDGAVKRARIDAIADVDAILASGGLDAVRASLMPGRARRGWDGARHFQAIPERQQSRYSRAYYVASRDYARVIVGAA